MSMWTPADESLCAVVERLRVQICDEVRARQAAEADRDRWLALLKKREATLDEIRKLLEGGER